MYLDDFYKRKLHIILLILLLNTAGILYVIKVVSGEWLKTTNEVTNSWVQSEFVNIQQGNLLSSISKYQRVIDKSYFLTGVTIFKIYPDNIENLAIFGNPFTNIQPPKLLNEEVAVQNCGLFKFCGYYRTKKNEDIYIRFDVSPNSAKQICMSMTIILFLISSFSLFLIFNYEKIETLRRQKIIKMALTELLENREMSNEMKQTAPSLVPVWEELSTEFIRLKSIEMESKLSNQVNQIATQVAHDIRSPLTALNFALKKFQNIPIEQSNLIKAATLRIQTIANDLIEFKKNSPRKTTLLEITSLIDNLIKEKAITVSQNILINFENDIQSNELEIKALTNSAILIRIMSNLINNSIESLDNDKNNCLITVSVKNLGNFLSISVIDNGIGIPKNVIPLLWNEGSSYGKNTKDSGLGLGLYYCKKMVESWSGSCSLVSELKIGTKLTMLLKITYN
jgi:signal transduction histidine kinase